MLGACSPVEYPRMWMVLALMVEPRQLTAHECIWPIIVGTHHKAGHTAARLIWKAVAKYVGAHYDEGWCIYSSCAARCSVISICAQIDISLSNWPLPEPSYFVQTLRDPLEMLISAYQYHRSLSNAGLTDIEVAYHEPWAFEKIGVAQHQLVASCPAMLNSIHGHKSVSYVQLLNSVSVEEGLTIEFRHMLGWSIGDMLALYKRARAEIPTRFIPLRLERLSRDWNRTLRQMFAQTGMLVRMGDHIDVADEYRQANPRHASNKSEKIRFREMLVRDAALCMPLRHMQQALGYQGALCLEGPADHNVALGLHSGAHESLQ